MNANIRDQGDPLLDVRPGAKSLQRGTLYLPSHGGGVTPYVLLGVLPMEDEELPLFVLVGSIHVDGLSSPLI